MLEYYNKITEKWQAAVGVAVLLAIIAAGVAMCIINGSRLSEFEYLGKEEIKLDNGVADMVKCKNDDNAHSFTVKFATGVVLCILGVIPLILAAALKQKVQNMICICDMCKYSFGIHQYRSLLFCVGRYG